MTSQYETVFIMSPVLSDEQMEETAKKYKKILTDGGAGLVAEEKWGLRKLAYPIQKKSTGFYYSVEYKGTGKVIPELEIAFGRDERILRFLTVRLDKHAIAYSEKRRNKLKGMKPASRNQSVRTPMEKSATRNQSVRTPMEKPEPGNRQPETRNQEPVTSNQEQVPNI